MKKTFKIVYGFGENEFIEISKNELASAYYAMQNETNIVTEIGTMLRGKNILRIEVNWNAVMGYNRGYKLTDEDYLDIGEKRQRHSQLIMGKAKEIAREVIESGNQALLKQELNAKFISTGTSDSAKQLAEVLKNK